MKAKNVVQLLSLKKQADNEYKLPWAPNILSSINQKKKIQLTCMNLLRHRAWNSGIVWNRKHMVKHNVVVATVRLSVFSLHNFSPIINEETSENMRALD